MDAAFVLGYTDGAQLYLPAERMLAEGGYEVDSYYEYGYPAGLAPGFEKVLEDTIRELESGWHKVDGGGWTGMATVEERMITALCRKQPDRLPVFILPEDGPEIR